MKRILGIICFVGFAVFAQGDDTDPVIRVKAQRALNNEHDLPPVPKGLTEPPPLPPPELHTHDIRKARRTTPVRARSAKSAPKKKASPSKGQSQKKVSGAKAKTTKVSSAQPVKKNGQTNKIAKKISRCGGARSVVRQAAKSVCPWDGAGGSNSLNA